VIASKDTANSGQASKNNKTQGEQIVNKSAKHFYFTFSSCDEAGVMAEQEARRVLSRAGGTAKKYGLHGQTPSASTFLGVFQ
jgi:hypothetical protein